MVRDKQFQWLTIEEAAEETGIDEEELTGYLIRKNAVALFQQRSLLFDKQRWEQGEPCLQLLSLDDQEARKPENQINREAREPENQIDDPPIEEDTDHAGAAVAASPSPPPAAVEATEEERSTPAPLASATAKGTQEVEQRAYDWDTTPIKLTVTWQPLKPGETNRSVLLSATTYDDFPISDLIPASDLGELPPVLQAMLDDLRQDLESRKFRYQQKPKPKQQRRPSPVAPKPTANTPATAAAQETQISLI